MNVHLELSAIKQTKWYEYLVRFAFGGLITVAAGLVARKYGLVIGGLFLAFPSIFPASVTLVQTHREEKGKQQGEEKQDRRRKGIEAAGTTAQGAALGSFGLFSFAIVIWKLSLNLAPWLVLLIALVLWLGTGVLAWWVYQKISGNGKEPEQSSGGSDNE